MHERAHERARLAVRRSIYTICAAIVSLLHIAKGWVYQMGRSGETFRVQEEVSAKDQVWNLILYCQNFVICLALF